MKLANSDTVLQFGGNQWRYFLQTLWLLPMAVMSFPGIVWGLFTDPLSLLEIYLVLWAGVGLSHVCIYVHDVLVIVKSVLQVVVTIIQAPLALLSALIADMVNAFTMVCVHVKPYGMPVCVTVDYNFRTAHECSSIPAPLEDVVKPVQNFFCQAILLPTIPLSVDTALSNLAISINPNMCYPYADVWKVPYDLTAQMVGPSVDEFLHSDAVWAVSVVLVLTLMIIIVAVAARLVVDLRIPSSHTVTEVMLCMRYGPMKAKQREKMARAVLRRETKQRAILAAVTSVVVGALLLPWTVTLANQVRAAFTASLSPLVLTNQQSTADTIICELFCMGYTVQFLGIAWLVCLVLSKSSQTLWLLWQFAWRLCRQAAVLAVAPVVFICSIYIPDALMWSRVALREEEEEEVEEGRGRRKKRV